MGNTLPAARSTPSTIADQPGRIRGWSMDSVQSTHSESSAFSFVSQDSSSSTGSGTKKRGGGAPSDTVPCVSSRFETMCVTLMDVPWSATEALDDWRLLFGEEYLPSVCFAAAYVLALYGTVGNPTAWETLRQHGLAQHAHAACSVGGGLLHRVCCLRRREAADVAALLLECGACPAQVAYCPPTGAMAVDERPIDYGTSISPAHAGAVRSANLETLQCTHGGHMLSPLSAAAQWGHPAALQALLCPPNKPACQPTDRTASARGVVVRATRSTLLIPLSRGVTAILTPLTGNIQFSETAVLMQAAPALKAPPAALERDTLVHACVAALVAVRPRVVRQLLGAMDCTPGIHTRSILTAPGCNELVECSACPLPRKQGGVQGGATQRQPGVFTALNPSRLPRAPAALGALAAALLLSLPRGTAAERGSLACGLEMAAAGQKAPPAALTHLRAAKAACHAPLARAQAWSRRRGMLVHRVLSRQRAAHQHAP